MTQHNRRKETCDMQEEDGCRWADESADRAVIKTFAILGVDIGKPESVEEFREDLRFGKHMRKLTNHGMLAMVAFTVVALMGTMLYGIRHKIGIPP